MIDDPPDVPIEPRPDSATFRSEVIDLAGIRVQWGLPAFRANACKHTHLTYDSSERRVWCRDCKRTVENFDAFMVFVQAYEDIERAVRRKMELAAEAMAASLHRRATKAIDKAWSGNLCAIGCPHCGGGILPEDFEHGVRSRTSRALELERRKKKK